MEGPAVHLISCRGNAIIFNMDNLQAEPLRSSPPWARSVINIC